VKALAAMPAKRRNQQVPTHSPPRLTHAAATIIRPALAAPRFGLRIRISISLPSAVKNVIKRSTENPSSLHLRSAEILG